MKPSVIISLISFLLTVEVWGQQNDQITLRDLPYDVLQEFMILLRGQSLQETVECVDPKPSDFELLLYTRDTPEDPKVLDPNAPAPLDKNKPLILIIHGWIQDSNGYGQQSLKDAYLQRYDANVVMVNWGKLAFDLYTRAVCKLPKIAKIVADFLCTVSKESNIDLKQVHLVGHSLGGQMSGFIGQFTPSVCNQKIGRATALDPAGPLYTDAPVSRRLDPTDAVYVDVIHTNGGVFGYLKQCGHADFFVNCGTLQPGCVLPDININSIINLPIMAVGCPHFRVMDIMTEAVVTNDFKGIPCEYCPIGCPPVLSFFKNTVIMGEQSSAATRGSYFVMTDVKSPYAIKPLYGG